MDAASSNQKRRFDIRQNSQPKMYKDVHFWRWGMGRSFNGSYAEYALLPTHHVFAIQSDMTWADIAPFPKPILLHGVLCSNACVYKKTTPC